MNYNKTIKKTNIAINTLPSDQIVDSGERCESWASLKDPLFLCSAIQNQILPVLVFLRRTELKKKKDLHLNFRQIIVTKCVHNYKYHIKVYVK